MTIPFSPIEVFLPLGYLAFSIWAAYTSGYNAALMKMHHPKGAGKYGPYLGVAAAFAGIAAMIFIELDEIAYDTGFIRANLPYVLSHLSFFSFLLRQLTTFRFVISAYTEYVILGMALSLAASYVLTRSAFDYGKSRIENG
jgi:uncharacterized membrane protein